MGEHLGSSFAATAVRVPSRPEAGCAGREAMRGTTYALRRRRGIVGEPWVSPR
jgi:hypothetical protein